MKLRLVFVLLGLATQVVAQPYTAPPGVPYSRKANDTDFLGIVQALQRVDAQAADVKAYAAVGDGVTDDAPAINTALAGGNRTVTLPCGTYLLNDTLLVDSTTEIRGAGDCTVLKRSNTVDTSPAYTNCTPDSDVQNRDAIRNRLNDCGNTGIYIHDLTIDGSLITDGPLTGMNGSELAVHFGAVTQSTIERVTVRNWPQDAIHFRNGFGNRVVDATIDGFNLVWGNGAAINYETHTDANNASADPLVVDRVRIIADGPAFCSDNLGVACDDDADCPGDCIGGGIAGVSASAIDNGAQAPGLIVTNSSISVSNYHVGVQCNYARGCTVRGTNLRAVPTRAGGLTGMEKRMRGIQCFFTTSGTRPTNRDCVITGNTIVGDASVASLSTITLTRQQGGIFVQGDAATTNGIVLNDNTVRDFDLASTEAAVTIFGTVGTTLNGNTVANAVNGAALMRVGASTSAVSNLTAMGNTLGPSGAGVEAWQLQEASNTVIDGTIFTGVTTFFQFLGSNSIRTASGAVVAATGPVTCATTIPGARYFDTTIARSCFCNGQGTPRYCRDDTGACGSTTTDCG